LKNVLDLWGQKNNFVGTPVAVCLDKTEQPVLGHERIISNQYDRLKNTTRLSRHTSQLQ